MGKALIMANDTSTNNIESARQTYEGFMGWMKTGSIIAALVTAFVVVLIAS
jgi:hypothetical protein